MYLLFCLQIFFGLRFLLFFFFFAEFIPFTFQEIAFKFCIFIYYKSLKNQRKKITIIYRILQISKSFSWSYKNLFNWSSILNICLTSSCVKLKPIGSCHLNLIPFFFNLSVSFLNFFVSIITCFDSSLNITIFSPCTLSDFVSFVV